jgi:MGT family glycosyltransferase
MPVGRFLFVTWGGGGNVPPMLGLARRMNDRGHTVHFLASSGLRERIVATGSAFRPFDPVPAVKESVGRALEDEPESFFRILCGSEGASDLLAEIEREPADALVVDCMLLNGLCAAELSGLPTAALIHLLYEPWRIRGGIGEFARPLVDETRAKLGLTKLSDDLVLAQLWDGCASALIVTPQELDFPIETMPANARYVGPIFEPDTSPWEWDLPWLIDHTDPLVLVSFSSTYQHQEDAIRRTAQALASTEAHCLITLGEGLDADEFAMPSGVVARRWVPHTSVLPHASLVVTHAGHATVMAALANGVPMVCMPMGRDQFGTADRVEACGAGRTISAEASAQEIREAVDHVVGSRTFRDAAQRMAEIIAAYGNGERAVAELEGLL